MRRKLIVGTILIGLATWPFVVFQGIPIIIAYAVGGTMVALVALWIFEDAVRAQVDFEMDGRFDSEAKFLSDVELAEMEVGPRSHVMARPLSASEAEKLYAAEREARAQAARRTFFTAVVGSGGAGGVTARGGQSADSYDSPAIDRIDPA